MTTEANYSVTNQVNNNRNNEPSPLPANFMVFLAAVLMRTQDTQGKMRNANQFLTFRVAELQTIQYKKAFDPCKTEPGEGGHKKPTRTGGVFSYDQLMIQYYKALFDDAAKGDPASDKTQKAVKIAAARLNQMQIQYQADNTLFKNNMAQADGVVSKMRLAAQQDDQNLKKMTGNVEVMVRLLNFLTSIIAKYKKIK